MELFFGLCYTLFLVYLTINIGLLGLVAIFCYLYHGQEKGSLKGGLNRFTVLVPAHNEETSISQTVKSIQSLDYPKDRFELIVIADNCTDKTAEVSRSLNARVIERFHDTKRSKGYALERPRL